jgi:hypothetical protein
MGSTKLSVGAASSATKKPSIIAGGAGFEPGRSGKSLQIGIFDGCRGASDRRSQAENPEGVLAGRIDRRSRAMSSTHEAAKAVGGSRLLSRSRSITPTAANHARRLRPIAREWSCQCGLPRPSEQVRINSTFATAWRSAHRSITEMAAWLSLLLTRPSRCPAKALGFI